MQGTVKWFNDEKGFGFIAQDNDSKDMFVHCNDVIGRHVLSEGDRVEYQVRQGKKGLQAYEVSVL